MNVTWLPVTTRNTLAQRDLSGDANLSLITVAPQISDSVVKAKHCSQSIQPNDTAVDEAVH